MGVELRSGGGAEEWGEELKRYKGKLTVESLQKFMFIKCVNGKQINYRIYRAKNYMKHKCTKKH